MSRIARRTAAVASMLALLLSGTTAVLTVNEGTAAAGSCCTSRK
jgi:hypothetical protein